MDTPVSFLLPMDNPANVVFTRKNLAISLLLAMGFVGGALLMKFKPFPYPQIVGAAKNLKRKWAARSVDPSAVIAKQYSRDLGSESTKRSLDTALLPLTVGVLRASVGQDFPKGAGSITIVGDSVVVMDWLGGVYRQEGGRLVKKNFPALPNHIEAFVKSLTAPLSTSTLRVQDIEYLEDCTSLVVAHESFSPEKEMPRLAVSLIAIDPATMTPKGEWKTIFVSDFMPAEHYAGLAGGGRLTVAKTNKLLLSIGDYNLDGVMIDSPRVAQDPNSSFGKIIEIDWTTGKSRMISLGHRNPQGMLVTNDGRIFCTEHGPAGGDELNRVTEGANFGWPNVTLGTDYGVYNWPHASVQGAHDGYVLPAFAWVPSVGVSNLIQIRNFHRNWDGDFLVGSLKGSTLFRLRMSGDRVVYSEAMWIGQRVRDIAQTKSGTIVIWTDDAQLLFVDVDQETLQKNTRGMGFVGQQELTTCLTCHHFDVTGPTHLAPSLSQILGRAVASDTFARYSPSLKSKGGTWTPERLKEFISNPEAFAPGTSMPKLGLSTADIEKIVARLTNKAGGRPE